MGLLLGVILRCLAPPAWGSGEPVRLPQALPEYSLFRNTHSTAAAMVLDFWGLRGKTEPVKAFIAGINSYVQKCLCGQKGKPTVYLLGEGLGGFARYRGYELKVTEKVRDSRNPAERTTFAEYCRQIDAGRPVLLTWVAGPSVRQGLAVARERRKGWTAVGVGYRVDPRGRWVIVQEPRGDAERGRYGDTERGRHGETEGLGDAGRGRPPDPQTPDPRHPGTPAL